MPRSAASSSVASPASPASPASSLRVAALPFALPLDGVTDQLAQAARAGIGLAVFPEMSLLGTKRVDRLRRAELETLAEPMDGRSLGIVTDAVEATGVAAGVGLLERGPDGAIYNSYVVCMPGGTKHRHRKVYATENPHLQGGARLDVFDTPWGVTMSILIGADNYLPENARVAALKGATLLVAPHRGYAGGSDVSPQRDWFVRALPTHAGDNGMFAVLSDMHGEPNDRGGSGVALIADPSGAVIATGAGMQDPFATAAIDPELARRSLARQWLSARRPELYSSLIALDARDAAGAQRWMTSPPSREVQARGSVAVSFAVVGRRRVSG